MCNYVSLAGPAHNFLPIDLDCDDITDYSVAFLGSRKVVQIQTSMDQSYLILLAVEVLSTVYQMSYVIVVDGENTFWAAEESLAALGHWAKLYARLNSCTVSRFKK